MLELILLPVTIAWALLYSSTILAVFFGVPYVICKTVFGVLTGRQPPRPRDTYNDLFH